MNKSPEKLIFDQHLWQHFISEQQRFCEKVGLDFTPVLPDSIIGISDHIADVIHGLRHPAEGRTCGWYIWSGEYDAAEEFFKPVHAAHLLSLCPQTLPYLALPPGYRFLIDANGYEDIWFDEQLLRI